MSIKKTYVEIKTQEKTYQLTPNPRALMRILKEVGDPMLMVITMQIATKPPELMQVFKVLQIGMEESGYDLSNDEFDELFFKVGAATLYEPYSEFVGALVNKGEIPDPVSEEEFEQKMKGGNRAQRRAKKRVAPEKNPPE